VVPCIRRIQPSSGSWTDATTTTELLDSASVATYAGKNRVE
jgi:hypothetical protein